MMGVQAASAQLFYDFCLDDLQRPPKGGGDRRSREPPKGDRQLSSTPTWLETGGR